jgi:hypothetical protein
VCRDGNSDAPAKAECTFTGWSGVCFLNSRANFQLLSLCIVYVHTMMHYVLAGQFVHRLSPATCLVAAKFSQMLPFYLSTHSCVLLTTVSVMLFCATILCL